MFSPHLAELPGKVVGGGQSGPGLRVAREIAGAVRVQQIHQAVAVVVHVVRARHDTVRDVQRTAQHQGRLQTRKLVPRRTNL